jgi:hypothetical protein
VAQVERTVTTNDTAQLTDQVIFIDATAGNVTVTLPLANALGAGKTQRLAFKRIDSSGNTATIQRGGSNTIEGSTTTPLAALGGKDVVSDSVSAWWIVSDYLST